ncbi:peptidoglycan-binding domain-containing protein [Streptomyces sp. NPDC096323]|uniref:peptidoglycan-binding domain-containing protein n=1 Tax=Streptomyces sp. NPDC096323 TaxID=3155822 RepID=UPI003325E132
MPSCSSTTAPQTRAPRSSTEPDNATCHKRVETFSDRVAGDHDDHPTPQSRHRRACPRLPLRPPRRRTVPAATTSPPPFPPPRPPAQVETLRNGDEGAGVADVQQLLLRQGFTYVTVTGINDDATTRGVAQFQRDRSLTGDPPGAYGPATRTAPEGTR